MCQLRRNLGKSLKSRHFGKQTVSNFRTTMWVKYDGPVVVWCRPFDSILCNKGGELRNERGLTNFTKMRSVYTRRQVEMEIFEYGDGFYKLRRQHSTLGR